MRIALTPEALTGHLVSLPGWSHDHGKLVRDYTFPTFLAAISFVNQIAALAEAQDHHPDIDIRYTRVRLALVTHDANGITEADVRMAARINASNIGPL